MKKLKDKILYDVAPEYAIFIIGESAHGLKELHENGIIHRDMKPAQVLIYEDLSVKLCDFNLAKKFILDRQ